MMTKLSKSIVLLSFCLISLFSCSESDQNKEKDLTIPTAGEITVHVDESFKPIVEAQLTMFHEYYERAKVNIEYYPEDICYNNLINKKTDYAIVSRKLNQEESDIFKERTSRVAITPLALEGVAVIVNNQSNDSLISLDSLEKAFKEKTKYTLVFDKSGSSNFNYLKEKFSYNPEDSLNIYALNSTPEVIDFVNNNPENCIGFIGLSWVSDNDDPKVKKIKEKVKVLPVQAKDTLGQLKSYGPYQSYLATKEYPLYKEMNFVDIEGRAGLGLGFASFIAGDIGQRIILKFGLVPFVMPGRLINFKDVDTLKL